MTTETAITTSPKSRRLQGGRRPTLLERCLAGDQRAWDELYRIHHPKLMRVVKTMLGDQASHVHLVDEITARVWYALVREDARLLSRCEAQEQFQLDAFLMGLARIEILRHRRDQRRRQRHEVAGGRKAMRQRQLSDGELCRMIDDFVTTLTPQEQQFVDEVLLAPPVEDGNRNALGLRKSAVWQRRRRIRRKLEAFLAEPDLREA